MLKVDKRTTKTIYDINLTQYEVKLINNFYEEGLGEYVHIMALEDIFNNINELQEDLSKGEKLDDELKETKKLIKRILSFCEKRDIEYIWLFE